VLDFAIIGAPRAGTTSLFEWLDAHPEVHGSSPKETYFFMDDDHPLAVRQETRGKPTIHTSGRSALRQFYDESTDGLRFEATTHHYYQETARKVFSQLDPIPHVFFVLRRPAHRVRSSFLFTKHKLGFIDSGLSFNQYVDFLLGGEHSAMSKYYHSDSSLYIAERELELSQYVVWLKWWEEALGAKRVHPLVFEELIEEDHSVVRRICDILKIDPSFYTERSMPSENEAFLARSPALQRLVHTIGPQIPDGWMKWTIKAVYRAVQVQETTSGKPSGTERGVDNLKKYFRPWNKRLVRYSDLTLSRWGLME